MPARHRRLVTAGVLVAATVAVPSAALASSGTSPNKPNPAASSGSAAKSITSSNLPDLAASAGIDATRLQAALVAAKRAGGNTAAGVAAFAAAAGVSNATAQRIIDAAFDTPTDNSLTGPVAAAALANRLDITEATARRALQEIGALSEPNSVDPGSSAFAAIARRVGVGPAQLASALDGVKQSISGD